MAERTLQVENRIRNGEAVVAAGRTHRDLIAPLVAESVEELSESDVKKLIDGLCALLERRTDTLAAAEDRNVAELADDVPLRNARDRAVTLVVSRYTSARNRIESALGEEGLKRYGLESPPTRTPRPLVSQAQNAVKLLRKNAADIDDGIEATSTTTIADALAAAVAPLDEATKGLLTEVRENEAALTDRDRAIAEWSVAYQSVANMLSALFTLAGRADLAERIRPTVRRADGLEEAPPEPEPIASGGDPAVPPAEG